MRTIILFAILFLHINAYTQAAIELSNPSSLERKDEVLEIPWKEVVAVFSAIDTANFRVVNSKTKKQVPYQLEYRGTLQVQHLLVQVTLAPKSSLQLQLMQGKPALFPAKTYCRYVPERKDDFAWENDKIAFRMYGSALENTPKEMAYGTDVWVKRTDRLILNERYKRGEYHVDHGDGMDYYHVGLTLGAGGIAPYVHDTIWYSKNYRKWKVLDNGPLRSAFQLSYDEWNVAGQKVNVVKTISLDAGSQLNKVEVKYSFTETSALPVAIGIIKRKEGGTEWFNEGKGIMGYWEPQHGHDGTTGVGCLFIHPVQQMLMNNEHLLTMATAKPNEPFVYYSGAAWDKAGVITSAKKWFDYLEMFRQQIIQPVKVIVHK